MAARAKREAEVLEEEPGNENLDQTSETDTLSGAVGEADDDPFLTQLAKSLGYKEPDEWTKDHGPERERDPSRRLGVREYLLDTPNRIAALRESSERAARAAAAAIEDERQRKAEEATRVIRESEDPEERAKAAQELRQHAGPPPQTRQWIAKNPWFETDPDAQRVAATAMQRAFAIGLPIEEQIAAGEEAARRQFPQYFSNGVEQRLSDVRRQAPAPPQVQSGTRAGAPEPKEKGWAQIPRADREAFERHLLKAFTSRGLSKEQAQAKYAEGYFKEGVLPPNEREEDPWVREKRSNPWGRR